MSPREGFLEEGAELNVWRREEGTVAKGTRVSTGTEGLRCAVRIHDQEPTACEGSVGNETGREGRGLMAKVLECQAKGDKLHP